MKSSDHYLIITPPLKLTLPTLCNQCTKHKQAIPRTTTAWIIPSGYQWIALNYTIFGRKESGRRESKGSPSSPSVIC